MVARRALRPDMLLKMMFPAGVPVLLTCMLAPPPPPTETDVVEDAFEWSLPLGEEIPCICSWMSLPVPVAIRRMPSAPWICSWMPPPLPSAPVGPLTRRMVPPRAAMTAAVVDWLLALFVLMFNIR